MKKIFLIISALLAFSFASKADNLRILAEAGDEATLTAAIAQFEDANPGVTVEASYLGWDDFMSTIKLKMADNNPPDLAHGNQGFTVDGTLIQSGLVISLEKYAEQYGWKNLFADGALAEFMWSDDGATWGSGSLYGISPVAEDVIVYYNKDKLKSLGLAVPSNFSEFENALQVSKDAGELPIALGGADGWPIIHVWGLVEGAFVDPNQTRSWIFNAKNTDFNTDDRMKAAEKLADMASSGYFGSDSLGIGYDDANAMFMNGQGVFNLTGTWMTADFNSGMGDNVGAFAMPRSSGGVAGGGSFALPWHISSKSANPDLAAKFINHLMSNDFIDDLMGVGRVPAQSPTIDPTSNLQSEVIAASNALVGANAKTFYTDWATPGMYDTVTQELQKVIGGAASAQEFMDAMAAESVN
ncbi:extracellular solute-binding protein [bacterium]|nr:extracellular solute-binding protein [bacterium]